MGGLPEASMAGSLRIEGVARCYKCLISVVSMHMETSNLEGC